MKKIFITCGDVNGIGPEIALKAAVKLFNPHKFTFIILMPGNVFKSYAARLKIGLKVNNIKRIDSAAPSSLNIIELTDVKMKLGKPTKESGEAALESIKLALQFTKNEPRNSLLVTSPISKKSFEFAGVKFMGHTDLLKSYFGVKNIAMLFVSGKLKVTLATIHVPLRNIFKKINLNYFESQIPFLRKVLIKDFKIANPTIAFLGLNPHAGEQGRLGSEEEEILIPIIKRFRYCYGPFPADAYWGRKLQKKFDLTVGLYHDQSLIPFKMLAMDSGVNFTAGLPIVRTSPDHGTAFDIAGKLIASELSMVNAIKLAVKISNNRAGYG